MGRNSGKKMAKANKPLFAGMGQQVSFIFVLFFDFWLFFFLFLINLFVLVAKSSPSS